MNVVPIDSFDDPRVAPYRNLRDAELRDRESLFVAEGRLSVARLIDASPYPTRSVFVTKSALRALRPSLGKLPGHVPVYVSEHSVMKRVVGFDMHRGCLAAGERGRGREPGALVAGCPDGPALVVVLEEVANPENVGTVFRNAHAFGASFVLLTPGCADPLYRKAIRVSMASSLRLPFARVPRIGLRGSPGDPVESLSRAGFTLAALTPEPSARDLREVAAEHPAGCRIALLAGSEGDGLSSAALAAANVAIRVPIRAEVDSLNVATAVAIALHHFARLPGGESGAGPAA